MKPLTWDAINPFTGKPFTWDDKNLRWGSPSYYLEPGEPALRSSVHTFAEINDRCV